MNLTVVLEHPCERTPDGAIWTQPPFTTEFWTRYLEVFHRVCVVAPIRRGAAVSSGWQRMNEEKTVFVNAPGDLSLWRAVCYPGRPGHAICEAVGPANAVILRVGSPVAAWIEPFLRKTAHPYGLEVVADPADALASGGIIAPLGAWRQWWFPYQLRQQCTRACAIAYATEERLQRHYPPAPGIFLTYYADVQLPDAAFVQTARPALQARHPCRLITVGGSPQLSPALNVLIDAVDTCLWEHLDLRLTIIADNSCVSALRWRVMDAGLGDHVDLLETVPDGEALCTPLDHADLFVLPATTEGLPRTMIEAMARGLPCIGAQMGGMQELLLPEDTVQSGDAAALAAKIRHVVTNPQRMARMSARNLTKAKEYGAEALRQRRLAFYHYLGARTQVWQHTQQQ